MASTSPLLQQFTEFLREKALVATGDTVILGVSGGVDSMVMLDLFLALRTSWDLRLVVAHVNHQLRGTESDGDEDFVRQAAVRSQIPIQCKRADIPGLMHSKKISKQEAAREIRYAYFEEIRRQTNAGLVATAHHADDNAETVLLNVLRGAGIRGLAGIPLVRVSGHIIRPLLFAARQDILTYAREKGIVYREDSSNSTDAYARNYLRHRIVPLLKKEFGPEICDSMNRMADTMKEFARFVDRLVDERTALMVTVSTESMDVSIPFLQKEPRFLKEEIVLSLLKKLDVEPSASKVNTILDLCDDQTGHSLSLSGRVHVYKDRERLSFTTGIRDEPLLQNISIGGTYHHPQFTFSVSEPGPIPDRLPQNGLTEYIDAEQLDEPLLLRTWKEGDWFVPIGMHGSKKLSDFFGDEKVSLIEKNRIPVFESKDTIVWICGKRLDDRYKITTKTRRAIKLTYSPSTASNI